jgi:hypothetical protein
VVTLGSKVVTRAATPEAPVAAVFVGVVRLDFCELAVGVLVALT